MASPEGRNKTIIDAIYESELNFFLTEFGLIDDFREGRLRCFHTNQTITLDNLYGFFMHDGKVLAISLDPRAIDMAYQLQKKDESKGNAL